MNNKGQTTVMFSLMISVLFLFTLTALELNRIYMSRVKIIPCVHSMRSSIMADYNEDLFERYHLLFMDPTYGTGSEAVIEEKITDYLEASLNGEAGSGIYRFSIGEVALSKKETIMSNNMELLKRQIADYEKTIGMVNRAKQFAQELVGNESDVEGAAYETKVNAKELPIQKDDNEKNKDGAETEVKEEDVEDPRDKLKDSLKLGVLSYVAPGKTYSSENYNLKNPPSTQYQDKEDQERDHEFRDIEVLNNVLDMAAKEDMVSTLTEHTAFAHYVTAHFSNGVNSVVDSAMKCEVEYILKGKDNDYDNMEAVVNEMIWWRMPVNYAYLLTDMEKKSEALTLATTICVLTGTEPLIEIVKYLLLGCWAYGESLYEMQVLLSGENIPYVKADGNWYTDLQNLTPVNKVENATRGLSYEDCLMFLLAKKSSNALNVGYSRILDVIEANLKENYPTFHITDCVGAMTIQGKVTVNPLFQSIGDEDIYNYYFEEVISYEE